MKDQELRRLSRVELLKLLISQMTENETLRLEKERLSKELEDRRIRLENAGSIAEAALKINGVFEAAEAAASQYLENISRAQEFVKDSSNIAAKRAEKMLTDAQQESQKLILDAQQESQKILMEARQEAQRIRSEALLIWESFTQNDDGNEK